MGRHLKYPVGNGSVYKESSVRDNHNVRDEVLDRLGFGGQICMSCNARAPAEADACRKCGSSDLRPKKHDFRDD
jgi:ribosomal protein L40E